MPQPLIHQNENPAWNITTLVSLAFTPTVAKCPRASTEKIARAIARFSCRTKSASRSRYDVRCCKRENLSDRCGDCCRNDSRNCIAIISRYYTLLDRTHVRCCTGCPKFTSIFYFYFIEIHAQRHRVQIVIVYNNIYKTNYLKV